MAAESKRESIAELKHDAESAKNRLMDVQNKLFEIGAIREAQTLGTIIAKLETWQNK